MPLPFDPNLPNQYDKRLVPHLVSKNFMREVMYESPLKMFMGSDVNALINLSYKAPGTGREDTVALVRDHNYKKLIYDYDQITGKGSAMTFYADEIKARQSSLQPIVIQGLKLQKYDTPIKIADEARPLLKDALKRNIEYSLIKNATIDAYPDLTVGPDKTRAYFNGVPAANGNPANYDNNIARGIAAMGGADAQHSGCSVDSILQLKFLAMNGFREGTLDGANFERKITPYRRKYVHGYGAETFVYFMSPATYRSMRKDPEWAQYFYRGMKEEGQPSLLHTSRLRGVLEDILLIELPSLAETEFMIKGAGNSTNVAAWNLFCGAQAFSILFCGEPWFTSEITNHENNMEIALQNIRGHKAHIFPSKRSPNIFVENAIIHNFVQIG